MDQAQKHAERYEDTWCECLMQLNPYNSTPIISFGIMACPRCWEEPRCPWCWQSGSPPTPIAEAEETHGNTFDAELGGLPAEVPGSSGAPAGDNASSGSSSSSSSASSGSSPSTPSDGDLSVEDNQDLADCSSLLQIVSKVRCMGVGTWTTHTLFHADLSNSDLSAEKISMVGSLMRKCDILGLQETHGSLYDIEYLTGKFPSHHFSGSWCENLAGGIITAISKKLAGASPPVLTVIRAGRVNGTTFQIGAVT